MATISKKFKVKQNDGSFQEVLVASTSDQVYFKNNITLETKYNELVAKDIDLQNQIKSNDTDITNLQNKDTDLQNQINSNDTDITNLQTKDVDLQNQITSNDIELADHETRITNVTDAFNEFQSTANLTLKSLQEESDELQNILGSKSSSLSDPTATIIDKINTHDAQLPQIETNANTIAIIQQQIGASATEGSEATGLYLLIQNLQNQILLLENRVSLLENPSTEEPVDPEEGGETPMEPTE